MKVNVFNGLQWVTSTIQDQLVDFDNDTKIMVEKSQDDDKIRFDLNGSEAISFEKNLNNVFRINYKYQNGNMIIGEYSGVDLQLATNGNTLIGMGAGFDLTTGSHNTLIGAEAGPFVNGHSNTMLGSFAGGTSGNTGSGNTFVGSQAGGRNQSGSDNVFIGNVAGERNISGHENIYIGLFAGFLSEDGSKNVAMGTQAGSNVQTGNYGSVLIGCEAGRFGDIQTGNVLIGEKAGRGSFQSSHSNEKNVIIGYKAGINLTGSYNVMLGNLAGSLETGSNKLYIETTNSTTPLIYGEFDNDLVKVNGTLHISETARLTPLSSPPTCTSAEEGLLYFNANNRTLQVCKGSLGWKEVLTN